MLRQIRMMVVSVVSSGLILAGCGTDTAQQQGSPGSTINHKYADDATYCQALADRQAECSGMAVDPSGLDECTKGVACEWNTYRPELVVGKRACMADSECSADINACFEQVYMELTDTPRAIAFRDECTPRNAECGMQGHGFANDYCEEAAIKSDAMLDKLSDCISKPCDMIDVCLYELAFEAEDACL